MALRALFMPKWVALVSPGSTDEEDLLADSVELAQQLLAVEQEGDSVRFRVVDKASA